MSSFYRQQLESWLGTIDVKAHSVLDVGGADNPVWKRLRSFNIPTGGYKVLDIETSHKGKKPDIVHDMNYVSNNLMGIKVDVIFCLEVTEYLFNPLTAMKMMADLLREGGTLYISFPFMYPVHEPTDSDYLRYTKFGAEKLLKESGFEILENKSRIATHGADDLLHFFSKEQMRYKGALKTGTTFDIGYLITARKI